MKLTIAAGILAAQTLPVVSEESQQFSKESPMDFGGGLFALKNEQPIASKKKNHQQQQRTGTKARTGGALFHQHSHSGKQTLGEQGFSIQQREDVL